jgi:hypothetical protein
MFFRACRTTDMCSSSASGGIIDYRDIEREKISASPYLCEGITINRMDGPCPRPLRHPTRVRV